MEQESKYNFKKDIRTKVIGGLAFLLCSTIFVLGYYNYNIRDLKRDAVNYFKQLKPSSLEETVKSIAEAYGSESKSPFANVPWGPRY